MTYQRTLAEYRQTITDLATTIEATARAANLYRIHSKGRDGVEIIGKDAYVAWRAEQIADGLNASPKFIEAGIYHWIEPVLSKVEGAVGE